ncbi:hypothetical protein ACIGXM_14230 [Kitasatospora sp. NPDC052896]|uniref:hypothetical protein n=1 Tax=Kitasatospora sp. NPDC052896 TaxID=3364061 RepID=UPI0037C9F3E6
MPQFLVLGLAVFFVWDSLGRMLLAMATLYIPDPAKAPVRCAGVFALAWAGYHYLPVALAVPLALGAVVGVIEHTVSALRHSSEREAQAVQLRRTAVRSTPPFPRP